MEHQALTNQLRATLPYGGRYAKEFIWAKHQQIHAAYPDWLADDNSVAPLKQLDPRIAAKTDGQTGQ